MHLSRLAIREFSQPIHGHMAKLAVLSGLEFYDTSGGMNNIEDP